MYTFIYRQENQEEDVERTSFDRILEKENLNNRQNGIYEIPEMMQMLGNASLGPKGVSGRTMLLLLIMMIETLLL
jgi:hypothetical protein